MKLKRVSGLKSETKRLGPDGEGIGEVIRYEKGDIVYLPNQSVYCEVQGTYTNYRGNFCLQLALPADAKKLQLWAKKNPHRVKVLPVGHHIGGPN